MLRRTLGIFLIFFSVSTCFAAIKPEDLVVAESNEELIAKKNKFLQIEDSDLEQYERIVRQIDQFLATNQVASAEADKIRSEFDSFLTRRLNIIRKVFVVFRKEFSLISAHLEKVGPKRLPAFSSLAKVLDESLTEAKFKGSKEKWRDLKARVKALLDILRDKNVQQAYQDDLVLTAESAESAVFEAKVNLLHRWLLEGRLMEARPWILALEKQFGEKASCLALLAHYWLEEYKRTKDMPDMQSIIEKNLAKKFGSSAVVVTVKGNDLLQKSFLFYLEALRNGYPEEKEIPGLLPLYWERVRKMYEKIRPYWVYPNHFAGYVDYMKKMGSQCQAIVEQVPFRKYARPAYDLLNQMYAYWPSSAGPKVIEFQEIMRLNRLLSKKKL